MASHTSTRRGILGAVIVLPAALADPKALIGNGSSAIDRGIASYDYMRRFINSAPQNISRKEDERRHALFEAAMNHLLALVPVTADQLARKMAVLWSADCLPTEECVRVIMRDVHAVALQRAAH